MFGILGWIVFGLIVGVIAKLLMPGKDPGGIIVTILLGIVGAVLGGYAGRALGLYGPADSAGIFMSIFGAIVVLLIYRLACRADARSEQRQIRVQCGAFRCMGAIATDP